jgi:tRNA (guanine-N7-)-methyltransferase
MSLSLSRGRPLDPGSIGLTMSDLPPVGDDPSASRIDLRQWWPADRRDLPIELEIGCGKGTFLVQQAGVQPNVNFLGIEWAKQFWRYAADRLRRNGADHVRVLHGDARSFVTWYVPDESFHLVHIYFPDPWPKKRHHKRRIIDDVMLRQLHRVIEPSGRLRIVTDHDDYRAWIEDHLAGVEDLFEPVPFDRPASAGDDEVVGTNFERKYRREGRPFHAWERVRR